MIETFINKIKQIVLNHLEDEKFGVSDLASQIGLSRSQTLRKVKATTGKSVSQFIKEIRLVEGTKLIKEGEFTASEIAYKVGFSSPSYFSKCFHDFYGVTPGEYNNDINIDIKEFEIIESHKVKTLDKKSKYTYSIIAIILILLIGVFIFQKIIFPDKETKINNPSIAVLAFADLSPKQDHEWFSDGISIELIDMLNKIPELKVISSTSSFSYKGKKKTVKQIGKELNVNHILEGSVQKSNDTLHIKVQLVNAKDGSLTWSESYERNINKFLQVQDEIAYDIIKELKVTLLGSISKIKSTNTDSYMLYIKAKYLYSQHTNKDIIDAEDIIIRSLNIDSTYAPAWNLLSKIIYESTINLNLKSKKEGLKLVNKAAKKALELDANYAPAYASLCKVNLFQWNFNEANKNIKRALELNHRNSFILYTAALHANYSGRLEESINFFLQALKMDPFESRYYLNIGITYYFLNQLDAASINIEKFNATKPNAAIHHAYLSKVLLGQGKKTEALREAEKETNKFWNLYAKNFVVYALGKNQEADSLLTQFINKHSRTSPANIASIYAYRNEINNAFIWLNIAYQKPDPDLIVIINYPAFKNLYNDPRWDKFIHKMELPKDHWLYQKIN